MKLNREGTKTAKREYECEGKPFAGLKKLRDLRFFAVKIKLHSRGGPSPNNRKENVYFLITHHGYPTSHFCYDSMGQFMDFDKDRFTQQPAGYHLRWPTIWSGMALSYTFYPLQT